MTSGRISLNEDLELPGESPRTGFIPMLSITGT
jgi:hypothetical protein